MAKQRLFPEPAVDGRDPTQRFDDLASKVLSVSKKEINKREEKWRRDKHKRRPK